MDARIDSAAIVIFSNDLSSSDNCRVIISVPNKGIVTCRTGYFLYDVTEKMQITESGEVRDDPF